MAGYQRVLRGLITPLCEPLPYCSRQASSAIVVNESMINHCSNAHMCLSYTEEFAVYSGACYSLKLIVLTFMFDCVFLSILPIQQLDNLESILGGLRGSGSEFYPDPAVGGAASDAGSKAQGCGDDTMQGKQQHC